MSHTNIRPSLPPDRCLRFRKNSPRTETIRAILIEERPDLPMRQIELMAIDEAAKIVRSQFRYNTELLSGRDPSHKDCVAFRRLLLRYECGREFLHIHDLVVDAQGNIIKTGT